MARHDESIQLPYFSVHACILAHQNLESTPLLLSFSVPLVVAAEVPRAVVLSSIYEDFYL